MNMIRVVNIGKPGVSPTNKKNTAVPPVGFGYIYIPAGVDRDMFVTTCYRTGRVTIMDDAGGGMIKDCYITNEALQNLQFPMENGKVGQPVMWVAQGFQNQPVVVGTFNLTDRVINRSDEEFQVHREWNGNVLNIQGSAKDGTLFIDIKGDPGFIKISSAGGEKSVLELNSGGEVRVTGCQQLNATAYKEMNVQLLDVDSENRTGIVVNKDGITAEANYGREGNKSVLKSSISAEGFHDEATIGGKSYSNELRASGLSTKFQDSSIMLEDGTLTVEQGVVKLVLSGGKISWTNGLTSLEDLMNKVQSIIQNLSVTTPSGLGTLGPTSLVAVQEFELLLKSFFKE